MFGRFKKDIRRLHPFILPTITAITVYNFGWGFADPFFSLYLGTFTSDYTMIGILNTLYVVLAVVILIPLGHILDTTNHHAISHMARLGYVLAAVLYFLAGQFGSYPLLISALLCNSLFIAFVWSTTSATLMQFSTRSNSSFVFGLYFTSRNVAWALAALITVATIGFFPIHWIFIPVAVFVALSIVPTLHLTPTHSRTLWQGITALQPRTIVSQFISDVSQFNKEMWAMFGIAFLCYVIQLFWWTFVPLYGYGIGFSYAQLGFITAVITLPFIVSFFAAEISDRSERVRNIMIGLLLTGLSIAALAVVPHTMGSFIVLGMLSIAGQALILPSISAIVTLVAPEHLKGRASAFLDIIMFSSLALCSPIIGRMVDVLGWVSTFVFIGALFVIAGALTLVLKEHWLHKNLLYKVNHPSSKKLPYVL